MLNMRFRFVAPRQIVPWKSIKTRRHGPTRIARLSICDPTLILDGISGLSTSSNHDDPLHGLQIHLGEVAQKFCADQEYACLSVIQDVLHLDETHRMNTPGLGGRSWQWRLEPNQLTDEVVTRLLKLTRMTGRG